MSEEKKKYTKLYLVLTILAIISCFVVFVNIGKDINSPFSLTLQLESPDFACSDSKEDTAMQDSKGVVIDKEGQRLTVIDENRRLFSQIKFDLSNQYLNRARSACMYGDDLYVFGYLYDTNGIYYSEQRIVKFHANGSFSQVVYSESTNSDRFNTSWIYDFSIVKDTVYFVEYDYKTVSINKLESKPNTNSGTEYEKKNIRTFEPNDLIVAINYQANEDSCIMKNLTNNYIINNKGTQTFYSHVDFVNYIKSLNGVGSNLTYTVQENNENKTRLELIDKTTQNKYEIDSTEINSFDLNYNNASFAICNTDKNQAIFYYYKQDNLLVLDEVTYSIPTYIYIISFWLCLSYLIILAIVLVIRYFIRTYKKDLKKFFGVTIGVVVFVSVMLTTFYLCYEMYNKEKNDIYNQVQSQSLYFSETSNEIGDIIQNQNWRKDLSANRTYEKTLENFKKISKNLDLLCISSAKYDLDYIYQLLYYDKQEQGFRVLVDSRELVIIGEDDKHFNLESQQRLLNKETISGEDKDITDNYIYAYSPIYNSQNEVVGSVKIGSYVQSLDSQIGNIYFRLIVLLLLVLIVIYLLTSEIIETRKSFYRYKYYKKNKLFFPEINLIGSIDYIKNMIFNADCVLCVLVAKEMLVQYGMENDGVLMGLPALMVGVGMLFGPFIFGFVKRFLTIKKIYVIGSVMIIFTMAIAVFNVINNMYVMFCCVKFFFGIGFSLIDVSDSTYPLFISNKKFREGIIRRLSLTDIATSVLSVTIAGQLASVFGNQSIYLFITILGIVLLLVNIYVLPNNQFFKSNIIKNQKKIPLKNIIKLTFSPAIIMSILLIVFIFLINGYKSMLFPILVNGMNYSQTDISNLFAIGATVALIFNKAYFRFNDRFDVWPAAILNLTIISIIFCIFAINSTLWWSLIAVVLVYLIHRCLSSQRQILWPRQCIKSGIEPSTMQPFFSLVEGIATMLRPLILGIFINVAGNNACFMLGACLFIFTIIYFLITRNTALSERISNW